MAVSVTCTRVVAAPGKRIVMFGKTGVELTSLADARAYVDGLLTRDVLQAMLIAKWLLADPAGANPALVEGKTISADLSLPANIVRVA
jgi:hypothetical protein